VAVAVYLRAAVRRAAVDRYLLPAAQFAALAHVGTDRRTDTLPFHRLLRYCHKLATSLRQESKRIDRFHNTLLVLRCHNRLHYASTA